jgi:hypothetical protein
MPNAPDVPRKQDPNDFLMGGSVPSASFLKIGDSVTGVVCEPPTLQQQRDMDTGELKAWPDGNPMMQLVVTLQTDELDEKIEDDDGRRRIYVKFNMRKAVADAVRKAKAKALEVGGNLTVTYTSDGQPTGRAKSPPKFYTAVYVPPAANYLNDHREEPGAASTNGHWTWEQAQAEATKAGVSRDQLVRHLQSKGRKGWNDQRDTADAKAFLASQASSPFSEEQQFKDDNIPF